MAHVFQTFNKRTKKAHPKYRFQYADWQGRRCTATGTPDEDETRQLAEDVEAKHALIRKGHLPPPDQGKRNAALSFAKVKDEYLAWGKSQGGRGGRPWGEDHLRVKRLRLEWWEKALGLAILGDLRHILPRVEEALRRLQEEGQSGKTLSNTAEAIRSFCRWCVQRGYLAENPLANLVPFDTTPQSRRRALTTGEIQELLAAVPPDRRILYKVALCSGLRVNELRHLTVDHLDVERGSLRLDAAWTKGRRDGLQPLARDLVTELEDYARGKAAADPLLSLAGNPVDVLNRDLKRAGIPKKTLAGKVDFHSFRTCYCTLLFESGADVKTAQSLARHKTPDLTLNVYARSRDERLTEVAEAVGKAVLTLKADPENTTGAQRLAAGAESQGYVSPSDKSALGSTPTSGTLPSRAGMGHEKSDTGPLLSQGGQGQKPTADPPHKSRKLRDTTPKLPGPVLSTTGTQQVQNRIGADGSSPDTELAKVAAAWPRLAPAIRAGILAMIEASR